MKRSMQRVRQTVRGHKLELLWPEIKWQADHICFCHPLNFVSPLKQIICKCLMTLRLHSVWLPCTSTWHQKYSKWRSYDTRGSQAKTSFKIRILRTNNHLSMTNSFVKSYLIVSLIWVTTCTKNPQMIQMLNLASTNGCPTTLKKFKLAKCRTTCKAMEK